MIFRAAGHTPAALAAASAGANSNNNICSSTGVAVADIESKYRKHRPVYVWASLTRQSYDVYGGGLDRRTAAAAADSDGQEIYRTAPSRRESTDWRASGRRPDPATTNGRHIDSLTHKQKHARSHGYLLERYRVSCKVIRTTSTTRQKTLLNTGRQDEQQVRWDRTVSANVMSNRHQEYTNTLAMSPSLWRTFRWKCGQP